ncbi:D-proline reductase (dithiol) PrdD [Caloramator fervidus]|uniref:D-proline reductase (Dithiol) PrdD n=1 Tax=Caloramator fervidus TaxID=29344 RepID=A0A1H5X2P8_9CLOT|nr:proline reductase cluster protein PrdD [Caloramator fervidus]SEG06082.1 D-proline reductase (dithiol) PrdD [Caloramator fervidus]
MEERVLRRLVIKSFHINDVKFSEKTFIDIQNRTLYLRKNCIEEFISNEEDIKQAKLSIIPKDGRDIFVNSILDFSPIATKVLGRLGEGITHVLTGVCGMLTAVDEEGVQVAEFGSSEGILSQQVYFNRAGTPKDDDIIIHVDITLKKGMGTVRKGPTACHRVFDKVIQEIRNVLKKVNGRLCDERHEFIDSIKPLKKKVVIIKQVAGQGAMYDTLFLPNEPGGFEGGRSIIDVGNVPIILSPNEFRDGALRAMH